MRGGVEGRWAMEVKGGEGEQEEEGEEEDSS